MNIVKGSVVELIKPIHVTIDQPYSTIVRVNEYDTDVEVEKQYSVLPIGTMFRVLAVAPTEKQVLVLPLKEELLDVLYFHKKSAIVLPMTSVRVNETAGILF